MDEIVKKNIRIGGYNDKVRVNFTLKNNKYSNELLPKWQKLGFTGKVEHEECRELRT